MNLNIRSKLVLSTVLPVLLVYAVLFWLGVSQVRAHLSADSRQWLLEHARYQAARLAFGLSQLPVLADGLGNVALGESWVEVAVRDVYAELERNRSPTIALFVSDADGTVLRAGDLSPQLQALATQLPSDLPTDEVQVLSETTFNADYWLVSVSLQDSPWRLIAVSNIETALLPARQRATEMGLVLLFSLVVIMTALGLAARRLTQPLETLDASVQQIAQGNFSVAPRVTSNDELGDLARAITRMAGHIEDRERQLRRSKQALEQRVIERTSALLESNTQLTRQIEETRRTEEALRRTTQQAQQASRTKSEFLSNMSHELRTPLHGVLGYAQILRRDCKISPRQRESLDAIARCGQHLLTLINQILDLTKIEAGQVRMDIQNTDLRQLIADVRMIIAQRAANKGLELRVELEPDLPRAILTDAVKLKQILLNLLGNAVKFTPHGVITLTASLSEDRLIFEVADTGIGIPADKLDRIFDAFQQVREGQAADGTGLGLAINQRLIRLLGGESLRVDSIPGKGSLFRFSIPCQTAAEAPRIVAECAATEAASRRRLPPGIACHVMVVDESAHGRDLIASPLRDAGCQVETFASGAEAMDRLREQPFDVALFDESVLDARGGNAAHDMRRAAAFEPPRLIALGSILSADADRKARQAGFDAFLAKSRTEQQLIASIEELSSIRFESAAKSQRTPSAMAEWPDALADATAREITAAVDLGDIARLFEVADALSANPAAPRADVENMALMARMFDFDGLRALSERLQQRSRAQAGA